MRTVEFRGCKHLIFDRETMGTHMKIRAFRCSYGAYWERDQTMLPDKNCARDVQFCRKRGRLNSKTACLEGMARCDLYEEILHCVSVDTE